jgi:uncharacterized phage protein gp47/JayE
MRLKSYREIFEDMRDYVIARQNKITDFNEGSVAASMLEAVAREMAALYNKTVANIELYGQGMAYAQFDFERKAGLPATGSLVFSRYAPGVEREIPEGVKVSGGGLAFVTTKRGSIGAGALASSPIPASCTLAGSGGNVAANSVRTIDNPMYGVDSVDNPVAFSGGVSRETEEEYHNRFTEFIIGLGQSSVSGVRATALSVNGVRSVSVVEHYPAESGYHFTLYAENGSGALPAATKAALETVIIGNDTVDGVRACGVNARILAPSIAYINIAVVFRVDGAIPPSLIEEAIAKNITNYVNSRKIGEPYEKKMVYNMAVRQAGVSDIITISPANTLITKRQIIRLGALTVEGA